MSLEKRRIVMPRFNRSTSGALRRHAGARAVPELSPPPARALRPSPHVTSSTRAHVCKVVLGLFWLVDGGLQLQPFMLRTSFAREAARPAGCSVSPSFVAGPVHWAANLVAAHPGRLGRPVRDHPAWALGLGLLVRAQPPRTHARGPSLPWAIGVWWLGEGPRRAWPAGTAKPS